MKAYLKIIVVSLLFSQLFLACDNDTEDYFEDSASERIQKAIDKNKAILKTAEDGWLLQYIPDRNQSYGGYNYVVKFSEQDSCVVWSELMDDFDAPSKSLYTIRANGGPMLSFYTYNETLMKDFATPSYQNYLAKGGDYEFIIMEQSNDTIKLKGNLSRNTMLLTKMKTPFREYLTKTKELSEAVERRNIKGIKINGRKVEFSKKNRVITFKQEDGTEQKNPYIYTDKGIHFFEPLNIDGVTFQDLTFDTSGIDDVFKNEAGTSEIILYSEPPIDFSKSVWGLYLDDAQKCSEAVTKVYNEVYKENIDAIANLTMELSNRVLLGIRSRSSMVGIEFFSYTSPAHTRGFKAVYETVFYGKKTNPNELYMDYKNNGDGIAALEHFFPLRDVIIDNAPYIVEDVEETPKKVVKLTSKKNPEIWFTLTKLL